VRMASRGQHVTGTDGNDYQHRERVAAQYAVSATNKTRLKVLVVVHYLLGAAHLARLLPSLVNLSGVDIDMPLPPTPPPSSFLEFLWLLSIPFTLLATTAVRRSRTDFLQLFQVKISVCCIAPILVTLANQSSSILDAITNTSNYSKSDLYLGLPFVLLWSFVLFICLVVHICELVVSNTLIKAWSKHSKRK